MCHVDTWNQVAKEKGRTLVNESWESLGITMSLCARENQLQLESEFQLCDSNRNATLRNTGHAESHEVSKIIVFASRHSIPIFEYIIKELQAIRIT